MAEIDVAVEQAAEQHVDLTMKPGDLVDVGAIQLECVEVRGKRTKLVVRPKPLVAKRTIDKVSTGR